MDGKEVNAAQSAQSRHAERRNKRCLRVASIITFIIVFLLWGSASTVVIFFAQLSPEFPEIDVPPRPPNLTLSDLVFLDCREDFYRDVTTAGFCVPDCNTWRTYPETDILLVTVSIIGVLISVLVVIISVVRAKQIFTFPTALIFYATISILIRDILYIISFFETQLFCSSRSYVEASFFSAVTPYCTISGMLDNYGVLQVSILWVCHAVALFWAIHYPFQARSFKKNKKYKYLHISCLLAGLILPLVVIIAPIADTAVNPPNNTTSLASTGFGHGLALTYHGCPGRTRAVNYALYFPLCFIAPFLTMILILSCFNIHKRYLFVKLTKSSKQPEISTAEVKLVLMVTYIITVYLFLTALYAATSDVSYFTNVIRYLICEAGGENPNAPCNGNLYHSAVVLYVILIILVNGVSPVIHLMFVVSLTGMKKQMKESTVKAKDTLVRTLSNNVV